MPVVQVAEFAAEKIKLEAAAAEQQLQLAEQAAGAYSACSASAHNSGLYCAHSALFHHSHRDTLPTHRRHSADTYAAGKIKLEAALAEMKAELAAALGNTQCLEQQLKQAEQTLELVEQGNSSICTNTLFGLVWLHVVWLHVRAAVVH